MIESDRAYSAKEVRQQYKDFFGPGEHKYLIIAPVWKAGMPNVPVLGEVFADSEFLAAKLAYDRGIWPSQCIPPIVKYVGPVKSRETIH